MGVPLSYVVNCGFAWVIVLLAVAGYFLTLRRTGERWAFWAVLAIGWGLFAISQTLLLGGVRPGEQYLVAVWLSSYLLVMASLVLIFIKLSKAKQRS
jgi:Na+/phosphate symporter